MHPSATQKLTLNEENGVLSHGHSKDKVSAHVLAQSDPVRPPRATPTPSCGALRAPHPNPACNQESKTNTKSYIECPHSTILVEPDGGGPVGTRADAQSLADLASRHAHQERHLDPCDAGEAATNESTNDAFMLSATFDQNDPHAIAGKNIMLAGPHQPQRQSMQHASSDLGDLDDKVLGDDYRCPPSSLELPRRGRRAGVGGCRE